MVNSETQGRLVDDLSKAITGNGTVDTGSVTALDAAGAYAVQAALFQRGDYAVAGFKLSLKPDGAYSAPLLFVESGDRYAHVPDIGVEPELALTLSKDLPARETPYSRDEIVEAIGKVSLGVEIIRSRFSTPPAWPLGLADFMSNIGYLVGAELDRGVLAEGFDLGQVRVESNGTVLVDQPAKHPDADPVAALVAYANGVPGPFGPLKAGQVVTTGSVCGAVKVPSTGTVFVGLLGKEYAFSLS
ncbi:hypothetical protein [Rhizobium sp. RU36D]|uniref:hypothetical protein n=1 Tax=Rhizobium sp. RU36D TaxID=1907415 RepID=UPI0009D8EBE0|nr:hypothetical protein [Rhizobium sp. RU36D]SMC71038.1 2-keto-4-pentenoate hydratase [Rhizobium sp. RU36D]